MIAARKQMQELFKLKLPLVTLGSKTLLVLLHLETVPDMLLLVPLKLVPVLAKPNVKKVFVPTQKSKYSTKITGHQTCKIIKQIKRLY